MLSAMQATATTLFERYAGEARAPLLVGAASGAFARPRCVTGDAA
jgi:hypothetical protein